MEKAKRYEIEGRILDIPVHWDERSQQYLEDYSSLIENPVYTPEGRPILLTIEDACRYSEPAERSPPPAVRRKPRPILRKAMASKLMTKLP